MKYTWLENLGEMLSTVVGVPGGLALELEGNIVEIGGVGEGSITLSDVKGITILADLDGDGLVDHITMHQFSGSYEVWSTQEAENVWGLPQNEIKGSTAGWGLEPDLPPERGWLNGNFSHNKRLWMRVDRG
ncbi:DUF6802 family protein [Corynebacterium callunae]|uniref:DUF6802 family protein n=1 Tax=Corynebacterium callunae TaxID=1721 RepID=UPI00398265C2